MEDAMKIMDKDSSGNVITIKSDQCDFNGDIFLQPSQHVRTLRMQYLYCDTVTYE